MADAVNLSAVNAYRNQMQLMKDAPASQEDTGLSFQKLMESAVQEATGTQAQSEALQLQSLAGGKVDLSELVTAVANAELTLNTVVAVRDRVISAYNDIVKMPI